MTYSVLVVCGTGMGSSMILKMMAEEVVAENKFPMTVASDLASSVRAIDPDVIVAGLDLAPTIVDVRGTVLGVKNIMDKNEIRSALQGFLDSQPAT